MTRDVVQKPRVEKSERPSVRFERYLDLRIAGCALEAIGRSRQTVARPGLPLHSHELFELAMVPRGDLQYTVNGRTLRLRPGFVLMTRPGEIHGAPSGVFQPCTFSWLQIDQKRLDDAAVMRDLRGVHARLIPDDGRLLQLHDDILAECRRMRPDSPRMIRAIVAQFLARLIRQAGAAGGTHLFPPPLQRALDALHGAPQKDWTLAQLQDRAGVGHSQLTSLFRTHLGQTPSAYALQLRLSAAHDALASSDQTITDIAFRFGFSSTQYFATAFRRRFGISPRQCRPTRSTSHRRN